MDDETEAKMPSKESEILSKKSVPGASPQKDERFATDGKGPTPKKNDSAKDSGSDWEWDGTIDEEAHLGWD